MSRPSLSEIEWLFDNILEQELGPDFEAILAIYSAMLVGFVVVAAIFTIAVYVVNGLALMKMGKKCGVAHPWLSWIPFAKSYVFGKIAETPDKPRRTGLVLLILNIVQSASGLLLVGSTAAIVNVAFRIGDGLADESALILPTLLLLFVNAALIGVGIAFAIVYYMAFYRITKLFGGTQYMTYFLLGFIPVFFGIGISVQIALLVLSAREPDAANFGPKDIWRTTAEINALPVPESVAKPEGVSEPEKISEPEDVSEPEDTEN